MAALVPFPFAFEEEPEAERLFDAKESLRCVKGFALERVFLVEGIDEDVVGAIIVFYEGGGKEKEAGITDEQGGVERNDIRSSGVDEQP
jgi:hypothetical protein